MTQDDDGDDGFDHHKIYDCDEFYIMLQAAVDYSGQLLITIASYFIM